MKALFGIFELVVLIAAIAVPRPTHADDYPNRPIRVISDSAPGSAVDVTFRLVMDRLGTKLGQQIAPVAQPGAGGAIAAHAASESIPDGYTLFAPAISLFISLPGKAENLPLMCRVISFRSARWPHSRCSSAPASHPVSETCRI
jgi:tripartite-type tricarboxylate transporter receptor subunit TctC